MEPSGLAEARQQIGLNQEQLAEAIDVDVSTVSRWETGETTPRGYNLHKLCQFLGKTPAQLALNRASHAISLPQNAAFRTLSENPTSRLISLAYTSHSSCQQVSDLMKRILEESMNTDPSRRDILMGALSCLVTLPMSTHVLQGMQYEATLRQCTAAIAACQELSTSACSADLKLAFDGVSAYQPIVEAIAKEAPALSKLAFDLATRCTLLKSILSWHRKGCLAAIHYAKQAKEYAEQAEDLPLQLSALSKLAWGYTYANKPDMAENAAEEAQHRILEYTRAGKHEPLPASLQGGIYSALAVVQSTNKHSSDEALGKALANDPGNETCALMEFSYYEQIREPSVVYYHQGNQAAAVQALQRLIDPETLVLKTNLSERRRLGIIHTLALSALKSKDRDMERVVFYWETLLNGAKTLQSEWSFEEAGSLYELMEFAWPGEERIEKLRDQMAHW